MDVIPGNGHSDGGLEMVKWDQAGYGKHTYSHACKAVCVFVAEGLQPIKAWAYRSQQLIEKSDQGASCRTMWTMAYSGFLGLDWNQVITTGQCYSSRRCFFLWETGPPIHLGQLVLPTVFLSHISLICLGHVVGLKNFRYVQLFWSLKKWKDGTRKEGQRVKSTTVNGQEANLTLYDSLKQNI